MSPDPPPSDRPDQIWRSPLPWGLALLVLIAGGVLISAWPAKGRPNGSLRELREIRIAAAEGQIGCESVAMLDLPASPITLVASGRVLYAPMAVNGFATIDITDPAAPRLASYLRGVKDVSDAEGNSVVGVLPDEERQTLYVLDRRKGISLFDVRDPFRPVLLKQLAPAADINLNAISMTRVGDYLYLACGGAGLHVLPRDFNPTSPWPAAIDYFDHTRQSAFLPPHWLLVSDGYDTGMQVLDLADPARPRTSHIFQTGTYCDQIVTFGEYAVMANRGLGFTVLNLSDPTDPFVANHRLPFQSGEVKCIAVWRGRYLLTGHDPGWIEGYDMADPEAPVRVLRQRAPAEVNTMTVAGDLLYTGVWGRDAMAVYRLTPPAGS